MKKAVSRYDATLLHVMESATELLRRIDARAWVWWFGGTLPFVAVLLHFWTDMSQAASAWSRLPGASFMLALAYGWMKVAHSVFADHLLRYLRDDPEPPPMQLRSKLRLVTSAMMIHATTPWILVLALLAMIPFGWAYAFYHNVTVMALTHFRAGGRTRDLIRIALQQSNYRAGQNHGVIIVLFVFAALILFNMLLGFYQVAAISKILTGEENAITRNPWMILSSTIFAMAVSLSYIVAGPLVKAVYALRCFHGQSRKNGEDLLVAFRRAGATLIIAIMAILTLSSAQAQPASPASAKPPARQSVNPDELGRQINEVLKQDRFQWRLPREEGVTKEDDGWLAGFFKAIGNWVRDMKNSVNKFIDDYIVRQIKDFLRGFRFKSSGSDLSPTTPWADMAHSVMVVLVVVLALLLIVLLVRHWMRMPPAQAKAEEAAPELNLENEQIIASQLPENEWLRLAQEKINQGDFRLALRALFLATLAHLGERRLLAIAKSKSNGDYVRELALRARDRSEMRGRFVENVRRFDWAWYGLHDVSRDVLDEFRNNHQLIVSDGRPR